MTEVVVVTSPCTPWTKKGKPLHEEDKSKEAPPRRGQERKATFIIELLIAGVMESGFKTATGGRSGGLSWRWSAQVSCGYCYGGIRHPARKH